ncbi:SdpI family protein [Eudoraea sp.]|uniref:SdpI family protein n=1 Tax=Eudoraea sp. TaxID=1979955 RepID=UPI003C793CA5
MTFNIIIIVPSLMTGLLVLIGGLIFKKNPPKKINWWYGYRTKRSVKNQEQWDFAQKLGAKNMIKYSLIPFLTTIFGFVIDIKYVGGSIGIVVFSTVLWAFLTIYETETKLISKFKKNND